MFSIIIVGYNVEKTIKRALDSVFCGNNSNSFELIYVDDGSYDKTRDIVDKYSKKHSIKKVYLKENTGIFNARCEGIKKATCEYSILLDADDELRKGSIDVIAKTINSKKFDICEYGINPVFNDGYVLDKSTIENYYNKTSDKVRNNDLLSECFLEERIIVNVWNKIYKTDLLKKIIEYNIYDHVNLEEDWVISLITLNECKKYHRINNKLVNYYAGGVFQLHIR